MCELEVVGPIYLAAFVKMEDDTQAPKEAERLEDWASEESDAVGVRALVADCG